MTPEESVLIGNCRVFFYVSKGKVKYSNVNKETLKKKFFEVFAKDGGILNFKKFFV